MCCFCGCVLLTEVSYFLFLLWYEVVKQKLLLLLLPTKKLCSFSCFSNALHKVLLGINFTTFLLLTFIEAKSTVNLEFFQDSGDDWQWRIAECLESLHCLIPFLLYPCTQRWRNLYHLTYSFVTEVMWYLNVQVGFRYEDLSLCYGWDKLIRWKNIFLVMVTVKIDLSGL